MLLESNGKTTSSVLIIIIIIIIIITLIKRHMQSYRGAEDKVCTLHVGLGACS